MDSKPDESKTASKTASMAQRSVVLSSYEEFLASENDHSEEGARAERLTRFPYSVMLQVAYPELDFANRWCWQQFGPAHGECQQFHSENCACDIKPKHCHLGVWTEVWFAKTDYDFGFNEWYFREKSHLERFLASVPSINWGEDYSQ